MSLSPNIKSSSFFLLAIVVEPQLDFAMIIIFTNMKRILTDLSKPYNKMKM